MRLMGLKDFAGTEGTAYRTTANEGEVKLVLESVQELPGSGRAGGAFRLEFLGPTAPMLEQATYDLSTDNDRFEIFIVPIAQTPKGTTYEAIFY
jgi:hypothetical protein